MDRVFLTCGTRAHGQQPTLTGRLGRFLTTFHPARWASQLSQGVGVWTALLICFGSVAQAQLRSGRVERELYPTEAQVQARIQARASTTKRQQRQPEIVAASHTRTQSILEDVGSVPLDEPYELNAQPMSSGSSVISSPVVHQAGAACGCASCEFGDWGLSSGLGCGGAGGCDDIGCSDCGSGLAEIAPTCATACPPGCGPLMALWYRMSVRGETPLYWRRAAAPPALVTTSPTGTAAGVAGQLGQSTTQILLGDTRLNEDLNVGARVTLSTWIDQAAEFGVLFRYWNAGDQNDTYSFNSNTNPILARPFFNTTVPANFENDTQLVAFPGQLTGNVSVVTTSQVDGLELSLRRRLYQDRFTRVDWLYGYQHISIDEGLVISSNTNVTGADTAISVTDGFHTENSFHGFSYGLMSSRHVACWKMESLIRLGAGNLRREVNISGATSTTSAGQTTTVNQGLLARSTNSRSYIDDTFIIIPEVGINFAYALRPGLDFNIGYNYMMIPKVAQASQQIGDSLAVNLSDPLTGTLDPALNFDERSYWLHSLGLGLQLRY